MIIFHSKLVKDQYAHTFFSTNSCICDLDSRFSQTSSSFHFAFGGEGPVVFWTNWSHNWFAVGWALALGNAEFIYSAFLSKATSYAHTRVNTCNEKGALLINTQDKYFLVSVKKEKYEPHRNCIQDELVIIKTL